MDLLLRGGRVIDTSKSGQGSSDAPFDSAVDVVVRDGRIAEIGQGLAEPPGGRTIDVTDKLVVPGLIDLHVHFREPGHEYKEDIESGCRSAAAGGFTTVCCMPNTKPVNDCRSVTDLIVRRARELGLVRVRPIGAISKGLAGDSLAEFGEMRDAGIVAVSDDGRPVMSAGLMRRALEYARTFDLPVVQHAEDLHLAEGGVMNEGAVSTRLGLRGQPPQAESVMVARDIELVEWTGGRYHVAHASTARTVELVREAKQRGLPVTVEVTPHHFALTDQACSSYDTSTKVAPPLRADADRQAILDGLADGTIDCIATDHAPHSDVEKDVEFDLAACGMLGLETALPLTLELVRDGVIDLYRAIALLTSKPAELFDLGAGPGSLATGSPADICVIDPTATWTVDRDSMVSKSRNTPFHGREVVGAALLTIVGGKIVFTREDGQAGTTT
jgi:dihydroorotase